jgi:rare lipoprotein A
MPRLAPLFPLAAISAICTCVIVVVANAAASPSTEEGLASVYGEQFNGKSTASGERYDGGKLTAAHRTLPLGTELKVTNLNNGKTVRVRINDRGPHVQGRIIDLSSSAAAALGLATGVARVKLEILSQPAQTGGPRSSRP